MAKNAISFSQTRWNLADLPASDPQTLESCFSIIETLVTSFEKQRPLLSATMEIEAFLETIRMLEGIYREAHMLDSYASLRFAEDTQDTAIQVLVSRVDNFMAGISNRLLFFTLWWKELNDADAELFMAAAGDYRYWLEEIRHFKQHTLSEPEEKIINIKNVTGANALNTIYDLITNRYAFKLTVDGEEREMTRGELMVYVRQSDPELRKAAYQELYRVYAADGPVLGQIYQTLVRDWRNEKIDLRGFKNPISARNLNNDIPDDVVNTLLDVCQK
ncbi:MAG: oligoendopeptidase F, partial [Anaerolineae bacterium]|nr:oligoendopeptidase F [Anaerolineae bacterium]